jgi:hypothetical protein
MQFLQMKGAFYETSLNLQMLSTRCQNIIGPLKNRHITVTVNCGDDYVEYGMYASMV